MGKQFGLNLNEQDFDSLCNHLYDDGYIIWGYEPYGRNFKKHSTIPFKGFNMNTYCITRIKPSEIKPYNDDHTKFFDANSYPVIEFSNWRFWIDSRAKCMPIWDEFDEIKKWVKRNFEYRNGNFCSKE